LKLILEWTYRTKSGASTTFTSPQLTPHEALLFAEDIEKTGRVKQLTITDEYDSTWMMKELKKYIKELETEPHDITLYFDGSFDHHSNTAGLGIVIFYTQNNMRYRLRKNTHFEYIESNNEAEYAALSFAINECIELGAHHQPINIKGDSQVVINQMNGEWPAYEKNLARWADQIDALLIKHGFEASYEFIARNYNKEADQLANQALQGIEISAISKQ